MGDIKDKFEDIKDKAIEKKGELKGRLKQMKEDSEQRSVNEE
jgi:hypothetical protein